jgi:L-Ala-D/L-Glu epimerase
MSIIEKVVVRPIERPFTKTFRNAKVTRTTLQYIRVAVHSAGWVGHGEMTALPGYSPETIASMTEAITAHFAPAVIGLDPLCEPAIETAVDQALPANAYARSALELALWDLRGKILGAPVHALIGGAVRDRVALGAIVPLADPEVMAQDALDWAQRGARTFQVKVSTQSAPSIARIRAVREAVGREAIIAIDGNGSFGLREALLTAEAAAREGVAFFEQPLPVWDLASMAEMVSAGVLPVVADEALVTARDALEFVRRRAATGFNLKLAKSGIAETRRIIAVAEAAGISCGLGSMLETRFGTLAGIHMAATLRAPLFSAELVGPWMVRDPAAALPRLAEGEFAWLLPTGPGWGAAPDLP